MNDYPLTLYLTGRSHLRINIYQSIWSVTDYYLSTLVRLGTIENVNGVVLRSFIYHKEQSGEGCVMGSM